LNNFDTFIEFRTAISAWSAKVKFLHRFVTNTFCLQKNCILDISLIKLLQNKQGCNFLPHSVF